MLKRRSLGSVSRHAASLIMSPRPTGRTNYSPSGSGSGRPPRSHSRQSDPTPAERPPGASRLPKMGIGRTRSVLQISNADQNRRGNSPAKQYGLLRRKCRQLTEKAAKSVRHQSTHQGFDRCRSRSGGEGTNYTGRELWVNSSEGRCDARTSPRPNFRPHALRARRLRGRPPLPPHSSLGHAPCVQRCEPLPAQ